MALLSRLIDERTDLDEADAHVLAAVVEEWSLISDLGLSDLVLWVPTWNVGGLVAVAQVRPTTAPTQVPDDVVGSFVPRGRYPAVDQAGAFGRPVHRRDDRRPTWPVSVEAYPIRRAGRVIGVVARHASTVPRVTGQLEEVYLQTADDILGMLVDGGFPAPGTGGIDAPRVGDGLLRLDGSARVTYASPNAISALRRLGLATDVVGADFGELAARLARRPGPMDEGLSAVAGGRVAGRADIENPAGVVLLRGLPLVREAVRVGAVVFVQDATDLRRRERDLLGKDATIREIHHRVKNNLQTVAAMLRLQARRAASPETAAALAEAQLRIAAIAVVHESLAAAEGQRVDADDVIDRVVALVRDLAPAYERPVPVLVRSGTWGPLEAALATPLAMVASELVHNAVEHSGGRRVEIELDGDTGGLVLTVADDGRGLPEGFDPGSGGLGLAIVGSLVRDDLGGTIDIDGPPGRGTRVVVRVPAG